MVGSAWRASLSEPTVMGPVAEPEQTMALTTDYFALGEGAVESLRSLERYLGGSRIDSRLLELVKLRASQINGCAYCAALHIEKARELDVAEDRLHAVAVWEESEAFTPRERAALAWTEALTDLPDGIPDAVRRDAASRFDEGELVDLTFGVVAINAWNRLNVGFREPAVDE